MWLKVVIIILFVALLISLFTGLNFLIKDQGKGKRQWYALGIRLSIAALLMGFLVYGAYTGQLGSKAPWDKRHFQQAEQPATEAQPSP